MPIENAPDKTASASQEAAQPGPMLDLCASRARIMRIRSMVCSSVRLPSFGYCLSHANVNLLGSRGG